MQPAPKKKVCSNCKGESAPTALTCRWCGVRLPRTRPKSRSPIWILAIAGAIVLLSLYTCGVLSALIPSSTRPAPTVPVVSTVQPQFPSGSPTVTSDALLTTIRIATRQAQAVQQSAHGPTAIAQAVIAEQSTVTAVAAGSNDTALAASAQATANP
jgi:ribosomal protein L40E